MDCGEIAEDVFAVDGAADGAVGEDERCVVAGGVTEVCGWRDGTYDMRWCGK